MPDQKQWVFTRLVEDTDDIRQLIAYAIYKADKDDYAKQLVRRRLPESQLPAYLERYHDSIAYSERQLDHYRDKAACIIDRLVLTVSQQVQYACDRKIASLKLSHEAELDKKWIEWGKNATAYSAYLAKPGWSATLMNGVIKWLLSGISGLLATLFSTLLIVGTLSLFAPEMRSAARNILKNGIDTLIPLNPTGLSDIGRHNE